MRFVLALITLLLDASALAAQDYPLSREWERSIASLPADPIAAAAMLNRLYARTGIPLSYWVNADSAERFFEHPPQGLEMHEHPCGAVAFIKAPTIPPQDSRVDGEDAIELSSAGVELRRWPLPTDQRVLAVLGDELVVSLYARSRSDLGLAIRPGGRYR